MALVIVILVLLLTLAFFYLKCSMMQSLMTLVSAILATIIAFSYYEWVAGQLISRGQGLNWALVGCFTVLFIVAFAIFRVISDLLIPAPIDLGDTIKLSVSLPCGLLTGLIISGNLLVALGLLPMHGKVFYSRFDPESPVILKQPKKPALSTDGFVTGLYSWISSGSMNSEQSFGVLHADYLSQIHLNKLKTKDEVLTVCSREALVLPKGKTKSPVRRKTVNGNEMIIVRLGVKTNGVESGGAGNNFSELKFLPAQVRMIVKKAGGMSGSLGGKATALYPVGLWENGKVAKWELNKIVAPDPKKIKNRVYWMDVVFECPASEKPVLLGFKQNAIVKLPEAVNSTPEIERALDNDDQKEESL